MEMKPKHPQIDLIYADALVNLPMSGVPPLEIPSRNKRDKNYFENFFFFAAYHSLDVGVFLLCIPKDRRIERTLDFESLGCITISDDNAESLRYRPDGKLWRGS